jgi:hypothetical protein
MSRKWLWPIYAGIIMLAVFAMKWMLPEANQSGNYWHLAALIGSFLVTIGWIVSSENTVRNAQSQHSVKIVLHYNDDKLGQDHRATILQYLPNDDMVLRPGGSIPPYDSEQNPLYIAVDYELNAFEFISVATLKEVLDEDLIKESFRQQFLFFYKMTKPYIEHTQGKYGKSVWRYFCKLCNKWERKSWDWSWLSDLIAPTLVVLASLWLLGYAFGWSGNSPANAMAEFHANGADYRAGKIVRMLQRLEGEVTNLKRIITSRR